jgi:NAD(P)-dependent dehydrogenase (short-subunit alcohol dehydrogenase family)
MLEASLQHGAGGYVPAAFDKVADDNEAGAGGGLGLPAAVQQGTSRRTPSWVIEPTHTETEMSENNVRRPIPPQPEQQQNPPGLTNAMNPPPDHGEDSYVGAGRLEGKVALITGGDSGIGRAVAIAFAREGADIVISYLNEDQDANDTARLVEAAGRKVVVLPGDITREEHCQHLVRQCLENFGRIDVLVNNAAFQRTYGDIADISTEEWDRTFRTNIYAPFFLARAAIPHMKRGSAIINTTSIQSRQPSPHLLAYASTKGAISNFTAGLAEMVADKGIRVNAVAPGPIWTPLIPSTMPPDKTKDFGKQALLGRAGQPAELAGAYVLLASDLGSYMTGAVIPVTGGEIMI